MSRNRIPHQPRGLNRLCFAALMGFVAWLAGAAPAQMLITGRVRLPRTPGSEDLFPCSTIVAFATPDGPGRQSVAARTWETEPAGWYRLTAPAGHYTFTYLSPSHFMRPVVLTNQVFDRRVWEPEDAGLGPLEIVRHIRPRADYAVLAERAWDPHASRGYYQTFTATSTSVTSIGFKLAHDGVDGEGPGSQTLLASIHQVAGADPVSWPRIGPEVPVLDVNAGGGLSIIHSAGWNSGEVPLVPGRTYAVQLRPKDPGGVFQCFWSDDVVPVGECYRIDADGAPAPTGKDMWLYVCGDGDGLLLPYNKRVHKEWHSLTRFGPKWSQTYVSQGRGLAAVVLYAAVATSQPPLPRQQATVRLRRGGPDGPTVGIEKVAVGQPTATAESGNLVVAFAPGEVILEPGESYAVEFEAFGRHNGFNPVMKQPLDPCEQGSAFFAGRERMDYDLDMVVVEYARAGGDWSAATTGENLLVNGDLQDGEMSAEDPEAGGPAAWTRFSLDPGTAFWYLPEAPGSRDRIARVVGGSVSGKTVDGGYVQRIDGLGRVETFRLTGQVRCSHIVDDQHQVLIGCDPTGQTDDPRAGTIRWQPLPDAERVWQSFTTPPVRPVDGSISVWLRARTTTVNGHPFEADFNNLALRRTAISPPVAP